MPSLCCTQMKCLQLRGDLKDELDSVCYKDFYLLTVLCLLCSCAVLDALVSSKTFTFD